LRLVFASNWPASNWLRQPVSIAPLVVFRIIFGAMVTFSTLRFWYLGWIEDHFIQSKFQFKYYGFEWVQLLSPTGMYTLHALMLLSALGIMLGAFYRLSALLFFLSFTYIELIDLTYYLNHYYFVSLVSLLLIAVPAHGRYSFDVWRNPTLLQTEVPRWCIFIFQLQLSIVYIYAGLAKINYTWLIEAFPLRIWLPPHSEMPVLGPLFAWKYTPWLFSWFGMLYDCCIVFALAYARTRPLAYLSVVVFHVLTGLLFQIGVFPLVMMGATWIFFSEKFHERLLSTLERLLGRKPPLQTSYSRQKSHWNFAAAVFLIPFFVFQLLFPWRYLLYPGNVFWTEQGYRFSWRVMLMEKAGTATFYVKDTRTGKEGVVNNGDFLCAHQEKQMAMQPDMLVQFAHFLKQYYAQQGVYDPSVRAEVYVTLNGQPSRLLFDPQIDLTSEKLKVKSYM
jgi:Vitamin K-dependent gamma-carboxylase